MFVITTNGRVITGWRAWLIGFGVVAASIFVFWLVAVLMLGLAVTVGTLMLLAIPAAAIVAFVGWLFGKWR